MSRPLAPYFIGALAGAAATIAAVFVLAFLYSDYLPAWSAERLYSGTPYSDASAKCDAANQAAIAWAAAGSSDRAIQWRDKAEPHCAMARLSGL